MESEFDLKSYISILRRRFWYLVLPLVVIALGGLGIAFLLPPVYSASATILVESQQIPTDLAAPTVTADASERIQVIGQRLLARDNLLQIANKFGLYDYEGVNRTPSSVVDNMRGAIRIQQIDAGASARRNIQVIGFTVSFEYRSPGTAASVTNELVSSILSQNIESRLSRASETAKFFEQQKNDIQQRLAALESRIADFRQANEDALPETMSVRRDKLSQLQALIAQIDQRLSFAQSAEASGTQVIGPAGSEQLGFTLQTRQVQLDALIEQRDQLIPLAEKGYIAKNRMSDLDRQISLAEIQVNSLKAQIADQNGTSLTGDGISQIQEQREVLEKQAKELSDSILKTPLVQVELNTMDREYENLQSEYRQAQAKLEDATTGQRLEQDRQAERFEVIEQATVPDEPSSPDRPRIILAGLFGGLAGGAALLILRQLLDKAVYTAADLERKLQLQAIVTIPYVTTRSEKRNKLWRSIAAIVLIMAIIAAALVAIDRFYLPLDILAERLLQRGHDWLAAIGLIK